MEKARCMNWLILIYVFPLVMASNQNIKPSALKKGHLPITKRKGIMYSGNSRKLFMNMEKKKNKRT
jgi:hypothetical protein